MSLISLRFFLKRNEMFIWWGECSTIDVGNWGTFHKLEFWDYSYFPFGWVTRWVHSGTLRPRIQVGRQTNNCHVYLAALTPMETLSYTAELRLPPKWTPHQRQAQVASVLALLKLSPCAHTQIGDAKTGPAIPFPRPSKFIDITHKRTGNWFV